MLEIIIQEEYFDNIKRMLFERSNYNNLVQKSWILKKILYPKGPENLSMETHL